MVQGPLDVESADFMHRLVKAFKFKR
jgi:hypothetical protein